MKIFLDELTAIFIGLTHTTHEDKTATRTATSSRKTSMDMHDDCFCYL